MVTTDSPTEDLCVCKRPCFRICAYAAARFGLIVSTSTTKAQPPVRFGSRSLASCRRAERRGWHLVLTSAYTKAGTLTVSCASLNG